VRTGARLCSMVKSFETACQKHGTVRSSYELYYFSKKILYFLQRMSEEHFQPWFFNKSNMAHKCIHSDTTTGRVAGAGAHNPLRLHRSQRRTTTPSTLPTRIINFDVVQVKVLSQFISKIHRLVAIHRFAAVPIQYCYLSHQDIA